MTTELRIGLHYLHTLTADNCVSNNTWWQFEIFSEFNNCYMKDFDVIKIHVTYTCIKPFKENSVLDGYARTKVTILYPSEAHFI